MSDPAVEAARRVCPGTDSLTALAIYRTAEAGAREALKPIRELHQTHSEALRLAVPGDPTADGVRYILELLEPLIYTTEELGQ
ncbi:hypothetical protein SEA_QUICKMATH_66 [Mycobacterium phage QuickMath]|uniref:Uncharacterized protein n=2 Tax=Cheoctovirus TaxID=1623281 RepID=A0A385DTX8_9CAUD|nr:hypothetical protein SEA_KIMBERLIUM_67 [Mycobacterium phage Kimberlium]YP_009961789.1 hypothetical protein I5H83_gp066 [Mycobacterium phage QuickMath]AKU43145.1 hypothetical protein SEA_KIMBERLIUM_67 [Mycobacterium phage Kimberlium]AXQ61995.1 hypothetical protein SEA_QUICKMATH_66 [Mycobacterium phage QuickMath]